MGNAHCHVFNDTDTAINIASYNTSDMVNWKPYRTYALDPNERIRIDAASDWRGLRLEAQYGTGKSGLFDASNGIEVKVSAILRAVGGSIPNDVVLALIKGTSSIVSAAVAK